MEAGIKGRAGGLDESSIAELVKRLGEQTSLLARQEVELAKVELTQKGKRFGIGAGAFGAAGVVALYAVGALTTAIIALLATAIDTWLAALIVTVSYAALAGVLALAGKKQVEAGAPPAPERAIESTKSDIARIKTRAKEGRS